MQGAQILSLVRELDPTGHNKRFCMQQRRFHMPQLRSATLIKKKKFPSWWHREQICGSPGGGWGRKKWEFGISRGKLLCIGWINKVLHYSRRNYTQYPIIKRHGKEYIHTDMHN